MTNSQGFVDTTFLVGDVVHCARRLLGCYLVRTIHDKTVIGKIVETEAYHQSDAASHSYKGQTPRTKVMFGPSGRAYVYLSYGMHYCMNIVTGPVGEGSAVLIRALEPVSGIDVMRQNRPGKPDHSLMNGPAKLCYALDITKEENGHDLRFPPLQLLPQDKIPDNDIFTATRIGISESRDTPWRFYIKANEFVSRK